MSSETAFIVHEHSRYTSAIDKYWLFENNESARKFFIKMVNGYKDSLDLDYYHEAYELDYDICDDDICDDDNLDHPPFDEYINSLLINPPSTVMLTDDCYIVMTEFNNENCARRT